MVRETAVSSKVRTVFNALVREYNGVSLNDYLEVGPNLLSNLTEILVALQAMVYWYLPRCRKGLFTDQRFRGRSRYAQILVESGWGDKALEILTCSIWELSVSAECHHPAPFCYIPNFPSDRGAQRQSLR